MISFIVIGKNEGWKLTKCFESIFNFISKNAIESSEVIYIDSKSTDDSLERATTYNQIKIFQITGVCNAAIARNIGAKESSGDILFFIDGDMEIHADFYKSVFDENIQIKYSFVSGGLINYNYNKKWNLISNSNYARNSLEDKIEHTTGGIFLIKKELWEKVGGMNTKYFRNQDLDLGLRLSSIGYPILRKKEIIANHHTIPYSDNSRLWKLLLNKSELYPSVLFREHIFNFYSNKKFIFENYTIFLLSITLIISIIFNNYSLLSLYLVVLMFKTIRLNGIRSNMLIYFLKMFLRDIFRFIAIFIFWPTKNALQYIKVPN